METIYYYKNYFGDFIFSTGEKLTDQDVSPFLRRLRRSGQEAVRLYPNEPADKAMICRVFGYRNDLTWKEIYHDCAE